MKLYALRVFMFAVCVSGLAGCVTEPYTPEQEAALARAGAAFSNMGNQLNQQQQSQPIQNFSQQQQTCRVTDLGGGTYMRDCR